jgi:hypothetical protein
MPSAQLRKEREAAQKTGRVRGMAVGNFAKLGRPLTLRKFADPRIGWRLMQPS